MVAISDAQREAKRRKEREKREQREHAAGTKHDEDEVSMTEMAPRSVSRLATKGRLASSSSVDGNFFDQPQEESSGTPLEHQEPPGWDEAGQMWFHYYDEDQSHRVDPGCMRVHHDSSFRRLWDAATCVALVYMSVTLPVFVALDIETDVTTSVDWIIDVMFIIDLVLNFVTTIADSNKMLVTDFKEIAYEYLTSWFIIDLVSSFQIEWVGGSKTVPREAFRMVKLLKLLKLMRVFRLGRLVGKAQERYQIKHATVMIAKFAFIILFSAHWLGCIYFFAARIQPADRTDKTWLTEYLSDVGYPIGERNDLEKYVAAMYWALTTMTTIGYGDIIPKTTVERCLTILCMIIGAFIFAYGLTNVCTLLFNHNKYQVDFECLTDEFTEFLDRHQVPTPLQQRVHAFLWFRHNSSSIEDFQENEERLLAHLSPQLRDALSLTISDDCFRHLRHFGKSPTLVWGNVMKVEVANYMIGQVYPPDEMIRGDELRDRRCKVLDRVNYVSKGLLTAHKGAPRDRGAAAGSLLHPGSSFGELEVLMRMPWNYAIAVTAVQHSDVYSIEGDILRRICDQFPVETQVMQRVFAARVQDFIQAEECTAIQKEMLELSETLVETDSLAAEDNHGTAEVAAVTIGDAAPIGASSNDGGAIARMCGSGSGGSVEGSGAGASSGLLRGDDVEGIMTEIMTTQDKLLHLKEALAFAKEKRAQGVVQ